MRKVLMGLAVSSMILTACNPEPEVSMTVPATANVGENVAMTNGSDAKKTYNVNWSFGDGGTASTWDANHVYDEAGTYTVTMTATNKKGNMATSATQVITVSDGGESALEDKMIADQVATDEWWTKAEGSWKFASGSVNYVACINTGNSSSFPSNAALASKIMFTINGNGNADTYMMNQYGQKMDWGFNYVDDTHVDVWGFDMPYTATTGSNRHASIGMPSGIYTYTNTGTSMTLTRITYSEDDDGTKYCEDKTTFTYTLTKQ